jgi:autotransporter translocation and assembly factor TamB
VVPAVDTGAPAVAPDAGAATASGEWQYEGHAQGRGVEPPIHAFAAHVQADAWNGQGTVRLTVPEHDGAVHGSLAFGTLQFDLRGFRSGDHVRATLDGPVEAGSAGAAADAADPAEARWRGTLDGTIAGGSLRGDWEASSGAGVRRREGTVDAARVSGSR